METRLRLDPQIARPAAVVGCVYEIKAPDISPA
jgi:hypothetical protein